ncbi:MAG TPA: MaoC/PaaZ C-terminal domain-containing protein [Propionibacteriaceae bacterium]|nr:MaoC/PaaZ C-terminal domain-containing protein [Propionibacteriaceae bacterium]HPZ50631.1 MaoC/PaaZ C-terminal domain-containing protein [Propionibacteriaceae bacterium]HQE31429.1 MaoC/PaaZ C-terminal domain-containing protein [Propionibacteriaceae bacterium]
MAGPLPPVGTTVSFSKTVSESDVYLFAGITGDLSRNHVDEAYMATTPYGGRIAHGMLVLSYASNTSTMIQTIAQRDCVSYGYDRVRFTAAVRIGDTITVTYTITEADEVADKTVATVETRRSDGTLVCVATHILKYF